jgi:hypothetical protein
VLFSCRYGKGVENPGAHRPTSGQCLGLKRTRTQRPSKPALQPCPQEVVPIWQAPIDVPPSRTAEREKSQCASSSPPRWPACSLRAGPHSQCVEPPARPRRSAKSRGIKELPDAGGAVAFPSEVAPSVGPRMVSHQRVQPDMRRTKPGRVRRSAVAAGSPCHWLPQRHTSLRMGLPRGPGILRRTFTVSTSNIHRIYLASG